MTEGILIVDYGTSKVHCNIIDPSNGSLIERADASYKWINPCEGWYEIDPERLWEASQNVVGSTVMASREKVELIGIGFSFMGDCLIAVDKDKNPITNIILSIDSRASEEEKDFFTNFGLKRFEVITGNPRMDGLVPGKILWMLRKEPKLFAKTAAFLSLQQYINGRLNLGYIGDYTLSCRKVMLDVRTYSWSKELCDYLHITPEQLGSDVRWSNEIIGTISNFGEVQLPRELPVILGAHDCECGMFGLGCLPGSTAVLANITGTFDHIGCLTSEQAIQLINPLTAYCGPVRNSWVAMGAAIAGPTIDWVSKTLFPKQKDDIIGELFSKYPMDGTNKLIMTRGLHGGNGCFTGFTLQTTNVNVFQAAVEGITYDLYEIIEKLCTYYNRPFNSIRIGGGGAKSDEWPQLKADIFNIPTEKVANPEISSLGSAIIAAVAFGVYPNYSAAMKNMIRVIKTFIPREEMNKNYRERYHIYRQIKQLQEVHV